MRERKTGLGVSVVSVLLLLRGTRRNSFSLQLETGNDLCPSSGEKAICEGNSPRKAQEVGENLRGVPGRSRILTSNQEFKPNWVVPPKLTWLIFSVFVCVCHCQSCFGPCYQEAV